MQTALYIHIPWCIKKCPYCDFNSHQAPENLSETAYIESLIEDFRIDIAHFNAREISSVFIGGGTPSLFSAESFSYLFKELKTLCPFKKDLEITLEANPGTVEQGKFEGYREVGINRLSIGIQSFHDPALKKIGRIHDAREAKNAVQVAHDVGFKRINIDLMYGIPGQNLSLGLNDLEQALSFPITHLSWYQFTLEPNTYFHKYPPLLPEDETIGELEEQGYALLAQAGFERYEISAFHQQHHICHHNLNYWTFGDYFGIGAGAHGKLTTDGVITRTQKTRLPKSYLNHKIPYLSERKTISLHDLRFEFVLNVSRLEQRIPYTLYTEQTGLPLDSVLPLLEQAQALGWIDLESHAWKVTPLGRKYTNDLQMLFL